MTARGKASIHATISLDSFVAGPHDEVDRSFRFRVVKA